MEKKLENKPLKTNYEKKRKKKKETFSKENHKKYKKYKKKFKLKKKLKIIFFHTQKEKCKGEILI